MMRFPRRQRTTFSQQQLDHLVEAFQINNYPEANDRNKLAQITKLDPSRIQVWFQNQRAKARKRQGPLHAHSHESHDLHIQQQLHRRHEQLLKTDTHYHQREQSPPLLGNHHHNHHHHRHHPYHNHHQPYHLSVREAGDALQFDRITQGVDDDESMNSPPHRRIYVFDTKLANEAAQAVADGRVSNIMEYHDLYVHQAEAL